MTLRPSLLLGVVSAASAAAALGLGVLWEKHRRRCNGLPPCNPECWSPATCTDLDGMGWRKGEEEGCRERRKAEGKQQQGGGRG